MKPVAEVSRVVVADDQPAFREVAREVIEETEGLELVGTAADCRGLPDLVDETRADVLLLDVRIPGADTLAMATRLRQARPALRVVLVSAESVLDIPDEVFAMGIGFLPKEVLTPHTLAEAVRGSGNDNDNDNNDSDNGSGYG